MTKNKQNKEQRQKTVKVTYGEREVKEEFKTMKRTQQAE
jgi:hypothetical protein